MPPIKMCPSNSLSSIKGEYFDYEYIKMSPRLSLIEEVIPNYQMTQRKVKKSKSM